MVEEIDDLSDNELNIEHGISSDDDLSMGFKARKIIEYENRIRQYSTPDKIFRYIILEYINSLQNIQCLCYDIFYYLNRNSVLPHIAIQLREMCFMSYVRSDPKSTVRRLTLVILSNN